MNRIATRRHSDEYDSAASAPRIALIVHAEEPLDSELLPKWLSSFAHVGAIVVIKEGRAPRIRRLRAEYRRVGFWRLLDVFAFRLYYRMFLATADRAWEQAQLESLGARFPDDTSAIPRLITKNPNDPAVAEFLRRSRPDLMLARCKWLLEKSVYQIPAQGTYVLHPGICPQYRNAHGCFWALACGDLGNVGLTLLRIDDGIDTGPIYAYFRYRFDAATETHIRIQERVVLENIDGISAKLSDIAGARTAAQSAVTQQSRNWGQPWLSAYLRWRRAARRRS